MIISHLHRSTSRFDASALARVTLSRRFGRAAIIPRMHRNQRDALRESQPCYWQAWATCTMDDIWSSLKIAHGHGWRPFALLPAALILFSAVFPLRVQVWHVGAGSQSHVHRQVDPLPVLGEHEKMPHAPIFALGLRATLPSSGRWSGR